MASTVPTPVIPPPPGMTSNWVDPDSIFWQIPATAGPCIALSLIFFSVRMYTSGFVTKRWYWDDAFIAIAQVCAVAHPIVDIAQKDNGLGRHVWDVTTQEYKHFMKLGGTAGQVTYSISLMCTKVSILLFYLRFPSSKPFKFATYVVMFLAVANGITGALSITYFCSPIAKYWDTSLPGKCTDSVIPFWIGAIVNMATDFLILSLPFWLLKPLRLPLPRMLAVALALMPGGFICGLTIVRVVDLPSSIGNPDVTWEFVNNFMWIIIELNVAIVCACLPCLPAFTKRHFPNLCIFRACIRYTLTELPTTFRRRWRGPSPPSTMNAKRDDYDNQGSIAEKDLEHQAGN